MEGRKEELRGYFEKRGVGMGEEKRAEIEGKFKVYLEEKLVGLG